MCGIVGVVGGPEPANERAEIVRAMRETLVHRGPDGCGMTHAPGCDLGLRRLAIVDIAGATGPHASEDGSIHAACNGEIYNYRDLRAELAGRGHAFHTSVDTEVLPHLYEEHGPAFVSRLDGMFAFAVWDERRRCLVLGRDRAGEKPLFYWVGDGELAFASELRALLAHPRVPRELDPVALSRYLLHDFFPAPLSPMALVQKLPAGCFLVSRGGQAQVHRYWDLALAFATPQAGGRSEAEVAAELDHHVARAVRRRKQSDVPVGVFLSGGVDSSAILAHLTEQDGRGVPVFALGHDDAAFDEARFARRTARHFGAEYHELVLSQADLGDGLRRVIAGFDEPLGDASTIPTHLLSLLARRHVKVVLSGEGGDELFAGYPTYLGHRVAEALARCPRGLRQGLVAAARRLSPKTMGNVGLDYLLDRFVQGAEHPLLERHHRWFGSFSPERQQDILAPAVLERLRDDDPFGSARAVVAGKRFHDSLSQLLFTDFSMYLQDGLLTKVDRATMLASLEARAPLLDHELVEYVAGLPSSMKLKRTTTKAILRRSLRARLPPDVLARRKRGFNIPFSRWLLHGLGAELRHRFSRERVLARGLFSPEGVERLLEEHLSRRADHRKPIFNLLAFDAWCDRTYGEAAHVPLAGASARVVTAGARS